MPSKFMITGRDFVNQVLAEIENSVLKPLEDIESSVEGILEGIAEGMNLERPRVIATINPVNECGDLVSSDKGCQVIAGRYLPEESVILIHYKVDMNTIIHLFAHHVHAVEMGRARYAQVRKLEELRLPWELRPTEVIAIYRTAQLIKALSARAWRTYNEEVKPRIKEIDERLGNVRLMVNYLERQVEHIISSRKPI
ncbi:MAG: hypothetical protein L7H10_03130 [Vulcanisaeta sp.]|jgi:hypothetical protein|nr:hypothetical protein [Vulcanisaeta sp.]